MQKDFMKLNMSFSIKNAKFLKNTKKSVIKSEIVLIKNLIAVSLQ